MKDDKGPISFFILSILTKLVLACRFKKINLDGGENLPARGAYICIANHSSRWDGPTLGTVVNRPANFMVSPNELKGLQGFLLSKVGAFPAHPRLDFVNYVITQFKKGEPLVIFPEGNVFYDGHTHPFKKGVARIAFAAHQNNLQVPIIPTAIRYENGAAYFKFGAPISIDDYMAELAVNAAAAGKRLTQSLHREVCHLSGELGNQADQRQLAHYQTGHFFKFECESRPKSKSSMSACPATEYDAAKLEPKLELDLELELELDLERELELTVIGAK